MQLVRQIYRYPIKGLSPQPVEQVELAAGQPFPFDRVFALARPGVPVDADAPKWAKKGLFVMLMLDDALAQVRTRLDPERLLLSVQQEGRVVLQADLKTHAGRAAVEQFFAMLVPTLRDAPRLVRSADGHFMDKPDNVVSMINLATVRSLEQRWGYKIDPLRFRANFYIDGFRPWQEFDWIGSDIELGETLFRVDRRNGRCGATNVNPDNGRRDLDIPGSLRNTFGHKDLGVYLIVRRAGRVASGDPVRVPQLAGAPLGHDAVPPPAVGRYICGGCYFIYDGARDRPGSPAFEALPDTWRCPDCGTDRSRFRPYREGDGRAPVAAVR